MTVTLRAPRLIAAMLAAAAPVLAWSAGLDFISGTDNMLRYAALPVTSVDSAQPQAMITLSKDHSLWLKAYNDFSDIDGDGAVDTTYKHSFRYYGYFDEGKCYVHNSSVFVAKNFASADGYCDGSSWSGNFLNWAAMARVDVVRRILFGGKRLVDGSVTIGDNRTVLERAYLPNDAHAWAKHYDGPDIAKLTPFNPPIGRTGADSRLNGITICNTTRKTNNAGSEVITDPPLIRVASGNFSLWAANERWQCLWQDESPINSTDANRCTTSPGSTGCNDNDFTLTGIPAHNRSPIRSRDRLGDGDYIARVQVCVPGLSAGDRCRQYPDGTLKPIGLLQEYGDSERMWFGMVTGTYSANKSGGDVQKRVGPFTDEVNVAVDGRFIKTFGLRNEAGQLTGSQQSASNGIINSLSLFRIVDYRHSDGTYDSGSSDRCGFRLASFRDGECKNWGNPLAEAFLAALRWFANQNSAIGDFRKNESSVLSGLNTPTNRSPSLSNDNSCASLNTIVFNSSLISYDGDQLDTNAYGPVKDLNTSNDSRALTNFVGRSEGMPGRQFFIGENGATSPGDDGHQNCSAKTITNLGDVRGICPEGPRLEGTFRIAGLAYHAYSNDINTGIPGNQTVKTYVVQLAPSTPSTRIPIPGSTPQRFITLLPSCQNDDLNPDTAENRRLRGACSIIDFKIAEPHTVAGGVGRGALYVNWENGEQGGDFDQDMWGMLRYQITSTEFSVTSNVIGYSGGGARMGFGYIVSGTTEDGVHFHSGAGGSNGDGASGGRNSGPFFFRSPVGGVDCSTRRSGANSADPGCRRGDPATTRTFKIGASTAEALKDPLWYAAKYGGYTGEHVFGSGSPLSRSQWDVENARGEPIPDGNPDNYFLAVEPRQLEESLRRVFDAIIGQTASGTAASVVANAREGVGAVFQALFEPQRRDNKGTEVSWAGSVHALWIDEQGRLREDGNGNARLDDFASDPVVEIFFDESNPVAENRRTRVRRFLGDPDALGTPTQVDDLGNLRVIWNARDQLARLANSAVTQQRNYGANASNGRHLLTFIDLNQNGLVDSGEQVPFTKASFSAGRFGILNAPNKATADRLVDFTRGQDDPQLRNRTLDLFSDNKPVTLRLGDIVQSTPTVAAGPTEAFDLLYDDSTYAAFRDRYRNRRQMVYVGSNNGLLHAFNAGFYDAADRRFRLTGARGEVSHPLGSELWAYAPYNLLPHLTWLTDPQYQHVWYVDGKPRVFDARVYNRPCNDATNPCGWATLMVVGFRFGGGDLTLPASDRNTRRAGFEDFSNLANNQVKTRSAFVVMDITDPEQPPKLLAELSGNSIGFTTSFPTVVANSSKGRSPASNPNDDAWYLVFGSGPDNLDTSRLNLVDVASSSTGKVFVHDLKRLASGLSSLAITYDLGNKAQNSFVGDPVTVDWDLDFKADAVYFGTSTTAVSRKRNDDAANAFIQSQGGALFKLDLASDPIVTRWVPPKIMLQPGAPSVTTPSVSFDELGNRWVYAGTGRLYTDLDKPTDFQNWLFGVIDHEKNTAAASEPMYNFNSKLVDVTGAVVTLANNLSGIGSVGGTTPTTVDQLEQLIGRTATEGATAPANGWRLNLRRPAADSPSQRNVTQTSVLGDVVFASGFTPSSDLCGGDGRSELYGLYYKTGTARGTLPILGTVGGSTASSATTIRSVDLGAGVASAPSLHVGAARDQRGITVLTQTSTGAIESREASVGAGARSGEIDWREPRQ